MKKWLWALPVIMMFVCTNMASAQLGGGAGGSVWLRKGRQVVDPVVQQPLTPEEQKQKDKETRDQMSKSLIALVGGFCGLILIALTFQAAFSWIGKRKERKNLLSTP